MENIYKNIPEIYKEYRGAGGGKVGRALGEGVGGEGEGVAASGKATIWMHTLLRAKPSRKKTFS